MKIVFVTNIYKEEEKKEMKRVKKEIKKLGFDNYKIFVNDGIKNNRGYAYGVNQGIKKGLKGGADILIVFNADISLAGLTKEMFFEGLNRFDILGFAFQQENKIYYGGEIDKWRLSGGLIQKKPPQKYFPVDFVSGSLMIIKKEVFEKTSLLDESYFFYYDETDFCFRAKKLGFKIGIDSENKYIHFELSKSNTRKDYFLAKNRLKFFWRYSNIQQKVYELFRLPKTLFEHLPLLKSLFINSKFMTNFLSLNISSIVNKIFHFFLFIFLVRNLPPEKYGIYTIVWAFIAFFNPFTDLGTTSYGLVYLPQEKKAMFNKLISLRFFISLLVFLIANIIGFLIFKSQKEVFLYIFLTSTTIISGAWSGSYLIINSIKEKVINSSMVSLIFNFFFVLLIVVVLLINKTLLSIFSIVCFIYVVYTIISFFLVKNEINKIIIRFDLKNWKEIISKSYLFVLISFLAGIYFKIDIFLLKYLKNDTAVGIYTSGYKFLDALLLISASYNITVIPILAKIKKDMNLLRRKIFKDFLLLIFLGGGIALLFYFFAPIFLPIILKKTYAGGIVAAQIVIFSLPFVLTASIFYNLLYIFDQAKMVLMILFIQSIINFVLNFIFIPIYSYTASAYITVFSEMLNLGLAYYFFNKKLSKT